MIEMTIESVRIKLATQQRVVILKTKVGERYIFLWIAHAEAYAIAVKLQGTHSVRPLTHDLTKNILEGLGGHIVRVEITKLIDEIFYAHVIVDVASQQLEFDARPSDALALAVRAGTPIFVAESVLEQCGVTLSESKEQNTSTSTAETSKETGQESQDTHPAKTSSLHQENGVLKQQLIRVQDELAKAQQRVTELEGKLPHEEGG